MDRERLYEILDIEEPAEFDYFENIAALLECDENIGYEELYGLLQEVDKETLSMLIDNYFEELSDFFPEDDADFYLKIDQIRRSLVGLAKSSDDENVLGSLAEELDRFRRWYAAESQVICSDLETGREEIHPLRDALALARMEKLDGDKYYYDFERCRDYDIDDYLMSFADMIAVSGVYDDEKNTVPDDWSSEEQQTYE